MTTGTVKGNTGPIKAERMLRAEEVARHWDCATQVVYDMCRDGRLRSVKIGSRLLRIPESALDEYVANSAQRAS